MLISRAWLEELLGATAAEPLGLDDAALGEAMTSVGLEVEGVTRVGEGLEKVVIGRVDGVRSHPSADRLRLVRLFDGTTTHEVVCGAPNVPDPGGKVVFAPVGTRLPGGLEIAAREIRGVPSAGMICAEDELEIGTDHSGILIVPDDWEPGDRLVDRVRGVLDTIYELSVTPNRPDALGHVGVARDLAVKLRRELRVPEVAPRTPADLPDLVTLRAPERCGRYIGRAYEGARVGPSPLWLRVRLQRLGLRPINDVVDITNLVLLEWGQPLHAFDRDRLAEGRVVVRRAAADEPMVTLDEQSLTLGEDDLVIADAQRPQALAGVMGGRDSGVEEGTTRLVLEAAWFAPAPVRRTARAHQLATDSSHRFERGVDWGEGLERAAARAGALIEALTGARLVGGHETRGELPTVARIELRPARARKILGMDIEGAEARRILAGLGIEVDDADPECWRCLAPSHRPDLQREEDLVEELVRQHGLEHLPMIPVVPSAPPRLERDRWEVEAQRARDLELRLADALVEAGLCEHVSFVFCGDEALEPFADETPLAAAVRLANPMRSASSVLRTHMLPGLLDALAFNVARHARPVRLFEQGRIYRWTEAPGAGSGPTAEVDALLPLERRRAVMLLSPGSRPDVAGPGEDPQALAGIVLDVLARLGHRARVRPCPRGSAVPWLHPGVQAMVGLEPHGHEIGRLGQVHPDLVERWGIDRSIPALYAELWVEGVPYPEPAAYGAVPRFPATSRDLSLEVPVDLPAAIVVDALRAAEAELPFDVGENDPPRLGPGDTSPDDIEVLEDYRGEGIAEGSRALLLRLHYRARQRSVTDTEVQARHAAIVDAACRALRDRAPDRADAIRTR